MAEKIVLLRQEQSGRSQEILDEFARRTGLEPRGIAGGVEFPLHSSDHQIEVVQTLTEIDPRWTDHLALGDPGA